MNGRPSIEPVKAIPLSGFGTWRASQLLTRRSRECRAFNAPRAPRCGGTNPRRLRVEWPPSPRGATSRPSNSTMEKGEEVQWLSYRVVVHLCEAGSAYAAIQCGSRRSGRIMKSRTRYWRTCVHGSSRRLERLIKRLRLSVASWDPVPAWTPGRRRSVRFTSPQTNRLALTLATLAAIARSSFGLDAGLRRLCQILMPDR